MVAYGSYNERSEKVLKAGIIVAGTNGACSIFSGFVVFGIIGYLAHESGLPVDAVVEGGSGLAFVVFPSALSLMPLAPFFSILFFFMLITLGIDSSFSLVEAFQAIVYDRFPWAKRNKVCTGQYSSLLATKI